MVRYLLTFLYVIPLLPYVEIMEKHVATKEYLQFRRATMDDASGSSAIEVLKRHPELVKNRETAKIMLEDAVFYCRAIVVQELLKRKVEANSESVSRCAAQGYFEIAKLLLESGANADKQRPIIAAMTSGGGNEEMIQLLLDHGADINRLFAMFGDKNAPKTALDFASPDWPIYKFLRDRGAKHFYEVLQENPNATVYDD
jgi:hypothetical protein